MSQSQHMNGSQRPIVTTNGTVLARQIDQWPTRHQARRLLGGMSTAKIKKLEKEGKLHPVADADGVWRLNPDELEDLADELGLTDDESGERARADAYARVDLGNSIKLLRSVTQPHDAQQARWAAMFDRVDAENARLRSRVEHLETKLEQAWQAQQNAEDRTHERKTIEGIMTAREQRTTMLLGQLVEHGAKFFNGSGTPFLESLDEEQMATYFGAFDMLRPAQQEALRAAAKKLGFDEAKLRACASEAEKVHAGGEPAPPVPGAAGATREAPGGAGAEGTSGAQSAKT